MPPASRLYPPFDDGKLDPGLRQCLMIFAVIFIMAGLALTSCTMDVIPSLSQRAAAHWTDVETEYRRRVDLIRDLVAAAQTPPALAQDKLAALTGARQQALASAAGAALLTDQTSFHRFEQAQDAVSAAIVAALAAGDAGGGTGNPGAAALRPEFAEADKRLAMARRGYIEAARRYNDALSQLPTLLWAKTVYASRQPFTEFSVKLGSDEIPRGKP